MCILRKFAVGALLSACAEAPASANLQSPPVVVQAEPVAAQPAPDGIEVLRLASHDARWRLRLAWNETTQTNGNVTEVHGSMTGTLAVLDSDASGAPTRVRLIVERAVVDEGQGQGLETAASSGTMVDIPLGPRYSMQEDSDQRPRPG